MQFYSQYGEDRILWEYFHRKNTGTCVEVGGFDGVTGSNSLFFEERGWKAVVVEPMPHFAERIRERRPQARLFNSAAGAKPGTITLTIPEGGEVLATTTMERSHRDRLERMQVPLRDITVPVRTMDDILTEAGVSNVDFITIDVEGAETEVLAGLDLQRWNVRIAVLENNLGKFSLHLHDAMLRRGYHFFRRTGCNEWYLSAQETHIVTGWYRVRNAVRAHLFRVLGVMQGPLKILWRESGLKAWNHRRLRARRARRAGAAP